MLQTGRRILLSEPAALFTLATSRAVSALGALLVLLACGAPQDVLVEEPVSATVTLSDSHGRYDLYRVTLSAASDSATGRLLRPRNAEGPFAAVLLPAGRETGSRAVELLPPEFGDVVVLSLDYPDALPDELSARELLLRGFRFRRELLRIPRLLSLGGAYLVQREDVDSARVAMVAVSFAVPFGILAAAEDERFHNVGLIYGAGDLQALLAANLPLRPAFLRSLVAWIIANVYGRGFEPTNFVAEIAPRPLIMVNGLGDPQVPVSAVEALYDAAREPKTLIWLRTGHLLPTDTALIHALTDTAFARLPALERARENRP